MNVERCKRTLLRPMPLARRCLFMALLSTTASPALSLEGTLEERMACTPDVLRLCSAFIPSADEITSCLRAKGAELSEACRIAVEAGPKQLPGAGDNLVARKRSAR
jgi:hypothetical protein